MNKKRIEIGNIPTVLWGEESSTIVIAVHGNQSNKEDVPMEMFARHAIANGAQMISFDLPEHGERKEEPTRCKVQNCVEELTQVMNYVKQKWGKIQLFANSMGAYFSLLAYRKESLEKAWFLSPVVDMELVINQMMEWFQISEERLKKEQVIETPIGQMMYWDYYQYVKEHRITKWDVTTHILYGEKDNLTPQNVITDFSKRFDCTLQVVPEAEHYFHTEEQLAQLEQWLHQTMMSTQR